MKKLLIAGAIAAFATSASAASMDMADITCKDLTSASAEDAGTMLMWLHGYYGGKAGDTKVDFAEFEKAAGAIGEFCGTNPDAKIIEELDKIQ